MSVLLAMPDLDAGVFVYLILAALSVLGGIFGKKKSDQDKKQSGKPGEGRPARRDGGLVQPPLPRAPRPPVPPRPTRPPVARPSVPPESSILRPRPVKPVPVPVQARKAVEAYQQVAISEITPTLISEPIEVVLEHEPEQVEVVRKLLRSKSGLRSAMIVSEILAPPVALRDNRQV